MALVFGRATRALSEFVSVAIHVQIELQNSVRHDLRGLWRYLMNVVLI